MEKKRTSFEEDDGRVVAPMNVEGMPWYAPKAPGVSSDNAEPLSRSELRAYRFAALKAGMLVAAVYGLGFLLLIGALCLLW